MRDIASKKGYERVWHEAQARQHKAVMDAIAEAIEIYGERINCAKLHRHLKARFPFAVCWGGVEHVLTEIGGVLYDETGVRFQRARLAEDPFFFNKSFHWGDTNDWQFSDAPMRDLDELQAQNTSGCEGRQSPFKRVLKSILAWRH